MPKRITIIDHSSISELEQLCRQARDGIVQSLLKSRIYHNYEFEKGAIKLLVIAQII